ncbi:hypothetical protein IAI18_10995 [Acetobacteraceae bacterium H6797]|nr:hypothetical protein [Acetobacteraceae bacterium H6797]
MFPGLETLLGSLLGGAFRLGQAILDAREKQREREHEHDMTALQGDLAERADERRLKELGLVNAYQYAGQELSAVQAGVQAQASEAQAAGGWVASLSASVRPIVTYLLVLFYMANKGSVVAASWHSGDLASAFLRIYSETDMALFSSILGFWFVDRSLRRKGSPIG